MTELDHVSSIKMATIEVDLHTAVTMEMADSLLFLLSDGILQKQVWVWFIWHYFDWLFFRMECSAKS